jgi:calcium/calmodulin-dependent protein kinase I
VFITLAYHPFGDLQQYLQAPLPEVEVGQITEQLLEGLKHMHDNGFAHRDLKPKVKLKLPNLLVNMRQHSRFTERSSGLERSQLESSDN